MNKRCAHSYEKENGEAVHASLMEKPKTDNREEWKKYWGKINSAWEWRTEPEIDDRRKEELSKCLTTKEVGVEQNIYPFSQTILHRDDIEWLLVTHESEKHVGPVYLSHLDEGHWDREGLDLRGAILLGEKKNEEYQPINLKGLPLAHLRAGLTAEERPKAPEEQCIKARVHMEGAILEGADLRKSYLHHAYLEQVELGSANLQQADLSDARAEYANFYNAKLQAANLNGIQLAGGSLSEAKLQGANLSNARLERVDLSKAEFEGADLTGAILERATVTNVILSSNKHEGPLLADVQWGDTNLATANWNEGILLGDEWQAKREEHKVDNYEKAVRAYRLLAIALRTQGLDENAVRFAYRANLLQRKVLWYQIFEKQKSKPEEKSESEEKTELEKKKRVGSPFTIFRNTIAALWKRMQKVGAYLFSLFLDGLAGYGYMPQRTLGWYFSVVLSFALLYTFLGHLAWWPDALVYSLTSFHGRGFLPNLDGQTATLHTPLVVIAAFEAVVGLLIELSFIATFTQRFFGK